ncbi:ATP-binding protein [Candidatus Kuenenia sp.]|uniref:ATP-binding protein n=1 Tax=Candidatus Kuenenia sp. TaxID=2499824 RepID=UPI00321FA0B8
MLPDIIKLRLEDIINNISESGVAGLALLDHDLNVVWANRSLSSILKLNYDPVGKSCREIFDCECKDKNSCTTLKVLSSGRKQYSEVQLSADKDTRKYMQNVSLPIKDEKGGITHLLKITTDITLKEEKIHQYDLLRKLAELMQGTLQIDRLLHLILTCVTAGTALGFNRARLFVVDHDRNIVFGKMAVGPSDVAEANKIWNEIAHKYKMLEDLIKASEDNYQYDSPLHMITRLMAYSLDDENEVIVSCIRKKKVIVEKNAFNNPNINKNFVNMIGSNEFVCVPLIVRDKAIGAICADNIYSKKPITDEMVMLLSTFANHAALAIENADAYKTLEKKIIQLKDAQERLVRSEKLAVIGNMAGYIAHEIRNPLVTIGGFARAIARETTDNKTIKNSAEIIIDEVSRLEKILAVVMDFSKVAKPAKVKTQVNEIVDNTISLMESYFKNIGVNVVKKYELMIPDIVVDQDQIRQVFLNIFKNAAESMQKGGKLIVETAKEDEYVRINITDTGEGMDADTLENIFTPFYTKKREGTGIGLAVSQKIVDDHEGFIKVKSELNQGATFSIFLPVKK